MRYVIGGLWIVFIIGFSAWWSRQRFRYDDDKGENWDAIRARMEERRRLRKQREAGIR
jgi:nitrogen fixation-related uncharacterized protein